MLFCRTGLPAAWLALAGEREERSQQQREEPAKMGFRPKIERA